jgi:hypothetical protein
MKIKLIIRDNAANIKCSIQNADCWWSPCIIHSLNILIYHIIYRIYDSSILDTIFALQSKLSNSGNFIQESMSSSTNNFWIMKCQICCYANGSLLLLGDNFIEEYIIINCVVDDGLPNVFEKLFPCGSWTLIWSIIEICRF